MKYEQRPCFNRNSDIIIEICHEIICYNIIKKHPMIYTESECER